MTTHYLKQFDLRPIVDEILTDGRGQPIDLTSAQAVRMHVRNEDGQVVIDRDGTIEDQTTTPGRATFTFTAPESDVAGIFKREWVIVWDEGIEQRVPNKGHDTLLIDTALSATPT